MGKELKDLEDALYWDYMDEVVSIIKRKHNQQQLKKGSSLGIAIDCFALGVIVGKRVERAKCKLKKISNAAALEREKELLFEVEALKLRNDKLEKSIAVISKKLMYAKPLKTIKRIVN